MPIEQGDIQVSRKTLLHISEGIYRTVGSSIKELISNSFDVGAKKVVINTNFPTFDILTCQDDGEGMVEDEFLRIVKGGIGDSPKVNIDQTDRPLIGKLGIGILALAQICRSFTIISHHEKSKTGFKGKMIFRTDVDKIAKEKPKNTILIDGNYDIGKWILEEKIEYDPHKKGLLIFTDDLRQSYIKRFKEDKILKDQVYNKIPLKFESLLNHFYENGYRAVKEMGPYYELIWELCQLSPLPYFENSPLRKEILSTIQNKSKNSNKQHKDFYDFITKKQGELVKYNFQVIFDDIQLFRAIKLPSPLYRNNKLQESQIFFMDYENIIRKRNLKFQFYLFSQENSIIPRDLKGIQIRIKNVGIGLNDATLLKYDKIESPRDNWVSGEIYIEEGLESALNIDRDSFNENDEHYFILRKEIHKYLENEVFPIIKAIQRNRNRQKQIRRQNAKAIEMKNSLTTLFTETLKLQLEFKEVDDIIIDTKYYRIIFSESILLSSFSKRRKFFSELLVNLLPYLTEKIKVSNKDLATIFNKISSILLD